MVDSNGDADPAAADFYERLGVHPDDSTDEIETVGNEVLSRLSPDPELPDADQESRQEQYERVFEAFKTLTDEEKRAAYDRRRAVMGLSAGDGPSPEWEGSSSDTGGSSSNNGEASPEPGGPGESSETATPDPVNLDVSADTTQPVYGTQVTFTVTDDDGVPVENALVTVDDSTKGTSDGSGKVALTVTVVGTVDVSATKPDTDHYREDSVTVEVAPEERELSVDVDADDVELGDGASVLVRSEDGDPVEDATVEVDGRTTRTDRHGQAKVEFPDTGSFDVMARKEGTEKTKYRSDRTSVDVVNEAVPLEITAPDVEGNAVTVGTEVKFVVREVEDDKSRLEGATVTAGDETESTDRYGACWFTFTTTGTMEVTATKEDASTTYSSDTVEITVENRGQLDVSPRVDQMEPRQPVTFDVRDPDRDPVEGARVEPVDRRGGTLTDRNGEATLRFSESGGVTVRASKGDGPTGYESATTTVMVRADGTGSPLDRWEPPSRGRPDLSMAVFVVVTLGLTVLSGAVLAMDFRPLVLAGGAAAFVVALVIVLLLVAYREG